MTNTSGSKPAATFTASISPNTAGIDEASKKLRLLQDQLIQLEKSAVRVANVTAGNAPNSKRRFTTFDQVLANNDARANSGGATPTLTGLSPELHALVDAIQKLTNHIGDFRRSGSEPAADPTDFMSPSQRLSHNSSMQQRQLKASEDQVKALNRANEQAQKRAERDARANPASGGSQRRAFDSAQAAAQQRKQMNEADSPSVRAGRPLSMGDRIAASVLSARGLSNLGALSTGNAGPFAGSILWNILGSGGNSTHTGSGILGRLLGGSSSAPSMGSKTPDAIGSAADSLGADASGVIGGIPGVGNLPGVSGAAGSLVSKIVGMVGGAGAVAGIGLAAAGVTEYVRLGRTQAGKYQNGLLASIGGLGEGDPGLVKPHTAWGDIMAIGQRYLVDPNTAYNTARQLGQSGIPYSGSGGHNLRSALNTTLGFATRANMDPSAVAELTSVFMVQGHRSADEVSRMFQVMEKQANKTGVPIAKLVDSMKTLEEATGGVGTSLLGVAGLATVQKITGAGINAGTLMAPLAGATGAQALSMAAMFGVSPDRFMADQGNPAAMLDLVSKWMRTQPNVHGKNTSTSVLLGYEQLFQSGNILGLAGADPKDQINLMRALASGTAASPKAQALLKKMHLEAPKDYNGRMSSLASDLATDPEKLKLEYQYFAASLDNANNYLGDYDKTVHDINQKTIDLTKAFDDFMKLLKDYKPPDDIGAIAKAAGRKSPPTPPPPPQGAHWVNGMQVGYQLLSGALAGKPQMSDITKSMYDNASAASAKTGVPLSVLLAQQASEAARGHVVTSKTDLMRMAQIDAQDRKITKGDDWSQALAMYHEGPKAYAEGPRNGLFGESQRYGRSVVSAADKLEITIEGTVKVDASGKGTLVIGRTAVGAKRQSIHVKS